MCVFDVLRRLAGRLGLPLVVVGVVVACGGGTSQVDPFHPKRFIVLGDEDSVILDSLTANGKKYSVNGVDANTARDCTLLPTWVQVVATYYQFAFAQCNPKGDVPLAFMRAKPQATIEHPALGIQAQIAEQAVQAGAVGTGDLVSVLFGTNDLVEIANQLVAGTLSYDQAAAEARRRGEVLAQSINVLLAADTRALVSTMPDISLSPYGRALELLRPGLGSQLSNLSYEFNAKLRTSIDATRFDGRNYALVLSDDLVVAMTNSASSYGLKNVSVGVCTVPLPECTNTPADLVPGATATEFMWADAHWMAPTTQQQIGSQAVTRSTNNPF